jgi:hypothetical protein
VGGSFFGPGGRRNYAAQPSDTPSGSVPAGGPLLPFVAILIGRADGYVTTPSERFATPTYALTRTRLDVDSDGPGWLLNDSWFGKVRIRGESPGAKMLFIGIGPEASVARYLGSVAHGSVEDIDFDPFRVKYRPIAGGEPQGPPAEQRFWAGSVSGAGAQTVTWKVREGDWSLVVMNADGSRVIAAHIDLGAELSFLVWVAIGLPLGGVLVVGGSTALIVLCRADATATARGAGASCRGPRIRKLVGTRGSRPLNRGAPAQLNAVSLSST